MRCARFVVVSWIFFHLLNNNMGVFTSEILSNVPLNYHIEIVPFCIKKCILVYVVGFLKAFIVVESLSLSGNN